MLSESENFGHAILEALEAGCVALIGDKTPWASVGEKGAGWNVSPSDLDRIIAALRTFIASSEVQFADMSAKARSIAREFRERSDMVAPYRRMFSLGDR
jgi:glycosyltransferase involved in cell wall biosynthesis